MPYYIGLMKGEEIGQFSPWDDQTDHAQAPSSNTQQFSKELKVQPRGRKVGISIEEEAKKTLLSLEDNMKQRKIERIRKYLQIRTESKQQSSIPKGITRPYPLHLPKITKTAVPIDSSLQFLKQSQQETTQHLLFEDSLQKASFQKKKKKKGKDRQKVERSVSFGSGICRGSIEYSDCKGNYATIDQENNRKRGRSGPLNLGGDFKLKGQRFAKSTNGSRVRVEGGEQVGYLPTQPNITPHYMLLGHNQQQILRKVMNQLQHKLK